MRFHHNQKVVVVQGYYSSFKGFIKEHRVNKNNKIEYNVSIIIKNQEPLLEWLPEEHLKKAWF